MSREPFKYNSATMILVFSLSLGMASFATESRGETCAEIKQQLVDHQDRVDSISTEKSELMDQVDNYEAVIDPANAGILDRIGKLGQELELLSLEIQRVLQFKDKKCRR